MNNRIIHLIRWVVGLLFIFSGLIKVNDPVGLSYKMQEFFEVGHLFFLNDYALFFSIAMNCFEVLAGVAVIIGWRIKLFSWLLLLLIIFFSFLTGFALFSGKIKTCGCFGDCIPLTAAQSFTKDLVLLLLIGILFFMRYKIQSIATQKSALFLLSSTVILSLLAQWYALRHLPFIDCLPYKVGNNIVEQMKMPKGAIADSMQIEFEYQKNGKLIRFDQDHFPPDFNEQYTYIGRQDKLVKKGNGLKPAIADFSLQTLSGNDTTAAVFAQQGKYILLLVQNAENREQWTIQLNNMLPKLQLKHIPLMIVSAEAGLLQPFFSGITLLNCDATVLKTAARVKPTFLVMDGADIVGKFSYLDADKHHF
ncbi:MAG: DoxX family membrane protein [Sphingobacteriia bacterium]|nr:MAG: DoxX family membrane protein [Sphingobacteriia bacterium]TAH06471.1 MAG: DoxX family membrane protein [Sphingobacteriia bacterium]